MGRVGGAAARDAEAVAVARAGPRAAGPVVQYAARHEPDRARHVLERAHARRPLTDMKLSAVFFDLDGTLADTERQNAEAVARVLERAGRPLSDEEREFVIGHGWHEIFHHLVQN